MTGLVPHAITIRLRPLGWLSTLRDSRRLAEPHTHRKKREARKAQVMRLTKEQAADNRAAMAEAKAVARMKAKGVRI
jgi:hypothetical protein